MAKVRGTNETTLDLANVADLSEEVQKAEKFRDNLILWDAAYKAKCEEEAKNGRPQMGRYSSSESITSGPSASSPLLRRNSPKSLRYGISCVLQFGRFLLKFDENGAPFFYIQTSIKIFSFFKAFFVKPKVP